MQPITPAYELGSSTGFKKRSLMRPASSSGIKEREFLRSIDISLPEAAIGSMLKTELAAIQEETNQLDLDKKIRLGESTLEKGYVLAVKKWLREQQTPAEKEEDEIRILKYMNVADLQSGFKKLWKVVGLLDAMIVRSTELQAVSLLKYDDLFLSLCKEYTPVTKKLGAISQGLNPATFLATQAMVERQQDLFSLVSRLKKSAPTSSSETDSVIAKLQEENAKLNSYLEKLTEQVKSKPKQVAQQPQHQPLATNNHTENQPLKVEKSLLDSVCAEVSQRYIQQVESLNKQVEQLLNEEARLKQELKISRDRQTMLEEDLKEATMKPIRQSNAQSFEAALQEQIGHMKAGYEAKITRLISDFAGREREMKKKENEYRVESEKVKFERSLLLKKYDLMK